MIRKISSSAAETLLDFTRIPRPKDLPFFGTALDLLRAGSGPHLHEYVDGRHKQLGPIYAEKLGPVSAVFTCDPEEMRRTFAQEGKYPMHVLPEAWVLYNELYGCARGLFFMDGEEWWENRRKMNRILLKGDTTWCSGCCRLASDKLVGKIQHGVLGNLEKELYEWSLDVLTAVVVGSSNYSNVSGVLESYVKKLSETVHEVFLTTSKLSLIPASLAAKWKIPRWRRFVKSVDDALGAAKALLLEISNAKLYAEDGLWARMEQQDIPTGTIHRILTDLILAAGDTTAYSMEWILYLIAKHKNVQNQLRFELKSNPETNFLNYVVKESLRLYPVAPFLTRITPEESRLGDYRIPKHTPIILSIYTSGRSQKYFDRPLEFLPERWGRESGLKVTPSACLPFAMGARSCIGKKIAEYQMQQTLAEIIKKFELELVDPHEVKMILKMVAVPARPINIKFVPCENT